jgi:hypothetical protein
MLVAVFACLLFFPWGSAAQQPTSTVKTPCSADVEHQACSLAFQAYDAAKDLQPGMTRADVEKAFEGDGGMQFGQTHRYTFKKCSGFKIVVEFKRLDGQPIGDWAPTDVVVSVSKVYVEPKHYD